MVTNLKAISNPLTIVAIFAGLAEVVGTVMLGLVDVSIQPIFVWFVMLFPVLIVCLFFATLNWNAKVLYAPSDFRDDETFMAAVFGAGRLKGRLDDIEEIVRRLGFTGQVRSSGAEIGAPNVGGEDSKPGMVSGGVSGAPVTGGQGAGENADTPVGVGAKTASVLPSAYDLHALYAELSKAKADADAILVSTKWAHLAPSQLMLLDALASAGGPLTAKELSGRAGLSLRATMHSLRMLEAQDLIRASDRGGFELVK